MISRNILKLRLGIPQESRSKSILHQALGINKAQAQRKNYVTVSPGPPGILISGVKGAEHEKVANFLLENFYKHEPMGIALGLNIQKEVANWLPKYVKAHFKLTPPVTSQAIDEATGKLVGINLAIVIDPKASRPPLMVDFLNPVTQPIKNQICVFLDEIEEGLNASELLGIKSLSSDDDPRIMDNLMISVHKDYCGRGIAVALLKKTEERAKKVKNCLVAKAVVTSEWSYRVYLKREFQVVREFQFSRYKNPDGIRIFEGKEDRLGVHEASRVMIKDISVHK